MDGWRSIEICLTYIGFLAKWSQQASSGPGHGWDLPLGLPPGWQGPGCLRHLVLPSQVHSPEAGGGDCDVGCASHRQWLNSLHRRAGPKVHSGI